MEARYSMKTLLVTILLVGCVEVNHAQSPSGVLMTKSDRYARACRLMPAQMERFTAESGDDAISSNMIHAVGARDLCSDPARDPIGEGLKEVVEVWDYGTDMTAEDLSWWGSTGAIELAEYSSSRQGWIARIGNTMLVWSESRALVGDVIAQSASDAESRLSEAARDLGVDWKCDEVVVVDWTRRSDAVGAGLHQYRHADHRGDDLLGQPAHRDGGGRLVVDLLPRAVRGHPVHRALPARDLDE